MIAIRMNEISNVLAGMGQERKAIFFQKDALVIFREREISESEAITLTDRKIRTKSGSTAIQVVQYIGHRSEITKHFDNTKDDLEISVLW
jgi:hypothetical protein